MIKDIVLAKALDDDATAALVLRQRRSNGVLMKAINFVGGQVEGGLKMLPVAARAQIDVVACRALEASYDAASPEPHHICRL